MNELNNDMRKFKRKPNGDRERFNEGLLYELYKEYPFDNSREIREFMLKHYGVYVSTNLIADITNYQIRKYGQRKSSGKSLIRIYEGTSKSWHRRDKERQRRKNRKNTRKFIQTKGRYYDGYKKKDR